MDWRRHMYRSICSYTSHLGKWRFNAIQFRRVFRETKKTCIESVGISVAKTVFLESANQFSFEAHTEVRISITIGPYTWSHVCARIVASMRMKPLFYIWWKKYRLFEPLSFAASYFDIVFAVHLNVLLYLIWLMIIDEGSIPEMNVWPLVFMWSVV